MPFRLLVLILLALVAFPASVVAAKPPVGKLADPVVSWVRIGTLDDGRVVVRVRVRHAPIGDPAPALRTVGAVTVVLSRFQGDRDYSVAGSTSARALPVTSGPIGVVYRMVLNARQSAAVVRTSAAGTLRALVLVDQRAQAKGRAPTRSGAFSSGPATTLALGAVVPPGAPPLLTKGERTSVTIGARDDGRPVVEQLVLPLSGGRRLVVATNVPLDVAGGPTAISGTVRVLSRDGTVLGEAPVPAGFTLAVPPAKAERGTVVWPSLAVPNVEPIAPGSVVVSPPTTRAGRR